MIPFFFLRFALIRLWLDHKVPFLAVAMALAFACSALMALAAIHLNRAETAGTLTNLIGQKQLAPSRRAPRPAEPALPVFSADQVVSDFGSVAEHVGLPLDEVTYALESGNQQPYQRYRIGVTVKSGYSQVRNFVAALAAEVPNATLDAIRCGRENVAASLVRCELTFSAFFRSDGGE